MPKTIESRSLSAPPASSPKTPNRLVHPLSTQLFPPPVPPQQQPLSPKHAWRRRWAKSTRFSRKDVHVRLDKGMELKSVRISTRSNKEIVLPATPTTAASDNSAEMASPVQEQEQTLSPTDDSVDDATSS